MNSFTAAAIIYNPNSTGSSEKIARDFADELNRTALKDNVKLIATKRAGHAEQLAYDIAKASSHPLIISSSGDGGYNEVVNGAMRAQAEGAHPTTGLLPAGNANDHYKNMHTTMAVPRILKADSKRMDVLLLQSKRGGQPWQRYAHSYIGVGLTPTVGRALNKVDLNPLNEPWVVLKSFLKLRGSKIMVDGRAKRYDNLIFSNVAKMSKVLTLSDEADMFDGLFEVSAFPSKSKLHLLGHVFKAAVTGLNAVEQSKRFTFTTIKPLVVQLDGEIFKLDAGSQVTVSCVPRTLDCLV